MNKVKSSTYTLPQVASVTIDPELRKIIFDMTNVIKALQSDVSELNKEIENLKSRVDTLENP